MTSELFSYICCWVKEYKAVKHHKTTKIMKKIGILAIVFYCLASSTLVSCKQEASVSTTLIERLQSMVEAGKFMYGHQDDLSYGHFWTVSDPQNDSLDRSDVKMVCGDFPALLGMDLGGIEMGWKSNLDTVSFDLIRRAAQEHVKRGGIVTIDWHLRNPLTGGDSWDTSSDKVVGSILEGGELHEMFVEWLCKLADYLETLEVPFIFRPWHEHSMGFFWWGAPYCTAEQYNSLWKMTYDYIQNERGIKDIIWAISPNASPDFPKWIERYPGDEYVDVIGLDYYDQTDAFSEELDACLAFQQEFAQEHGKILALTETGLESIPEADWWTGTLLPVVEKYPIAYMLTWRNSSTRPLHFYGPFPGAACEQDFVKFYTSEKTLFLEDISRF